MALVRIPWRSIFPRCVRLIEAMTCHHFDAKRPWSPDPVKDGHDHAVDALRTMLVNLPSDAGSWLVEY